MPNAEEIRELRKLWSAFWADLQAEDPWKEHAKWLFASASVVGTLAGAFQLLGGLAGSGRWLLGFAVLSLGGSLICATVALTPRWHQLLEERSTRIIARILGWRTWTVRAGSICFGLALALAAASPMVSEYYRNRMTPATAITFAVDSVGVLSAGFEGRRVAPLTLASLSLSGAVQTGLVATAVQGRTDSAGNVSLRLPAIRLTGGAGPFQLRGSWEEPRGTRQDQSVPVPGVPPPIP